MQRISVKSRPPPARPSQAQPKFVTDRLPQPAAGGPGQEAPRVARTEAGLSGSCVSGDGELIARLDIELTDLPGRQFENAVGIEIDAG